MGEANAWADISEVVFPKIDEAFVNKRAQERSKEAKARKLNLTDCASGTYFYALPRKGTTIRAKISSDCLMKDHGVELFQLKFNGTRFSLK